MRKKIFVGLLALVIMLCAACGQKPEQETIPVMSAQPTEVMQPTEATPAEHICASVCDICGTCADAQCAEAVCSEKCPGVHREEICQFAGGDYITDQAVSVDTGTVVFDIGENIFVPGHLEKAAQSLVAALEKVSGQNFDGTGDYARGSFSDGKVHVNTSRDMLYAGNPEHSWYMGLQTSEVGSVQASASRHVEVCPGDLFLGNEYAIAHELSHMLMFRQSEWSHCKLLNEGFAEYTTYLALKELEETEPEIAVYMGSASQAVFNIFIDDYAKLYEQPLEYWFENTFEHAGNGNYAIGFRFMSYLHDVYGDYGKWIDAFEETYSCRQNGGYNKESSVAKQIEVLKATYGADVLDGFYPWLKTNLDRFDSAKASNDLTDRTALEKINLYPEFNAFESRAILSKMECTDLYINLEPMRQYIGEYKQCDVNNLELITSGPAEVRLYRADGTFTTAKSAYNKGISLDGISYIKLMGTNKLGFVEIIGDFRVTQ